MKPQHSTVFKDIYFLMEQWSLEWHKSIDLSKYKFGIILANFILHIFLLPNFLLVDIFPQ